MAVQKGVIEQVRYATDYVYPNGEALATWTVIPDQKILSAEAQMPREEPVTQDNVNGAQLQAGVRSVFVLPVVQDDSDTWATALKTASSSHTPVWFSFKLLGQNMRVVGGEQGCQVTVGEAAAATFGNFATTLVGGSTTGADAGDTFEIVTP